LLSYGPFFDDLDWIRFKLFRAGLGWVESAVPFYNVEMPLSMVAVVVRIDGNEFPEDLFYHREHMWVRVEDGRVRVGYNDWAQSAAGKLLKINTRRAGSLVQEGKTLGTIESGKWVGPLKAPVSGKIIEVNEEVLRRPSLINEDPYGRGWVAVIEPTDLENELKKLIRGSDRATLEDWLRREKEVHKV
jgi:glycine cleavage system H protein